jgi:hypothetical protein
VIITVTITIGIIIIGFRVPGRREGREERRYGRMKASS